MITIKYGFCLAFILFSFTIKAQYGCMDPQALNYNPTATINDGSCLYPATNYSLNKLDTLHPKIDEVSGMIFYNHKLYGHNDSGNSPVLFEMDTLGIITKEIYLQGISNIDWEDITQDSIHIYIGDIGNNSGNRTDLCVYKFLKSAIGANYYDTISLNQIEKIHYSYPDQIDFTPNAQNTAFDCEALAYRNEKLHLFTKNWKGGACVHYTIPALAGTHVALRLDSLDTQGTLITAADLASNNQLMLIGYKTSGMAECSMWYIYDFDNSDYYFDKGNKRKIFLDYAPIVGQIESVCFKDTTAGYIANEHFHPIPQVNVLPTLYKFSTTNWFPYILNTGMNYYADNKNQLQIFTNKNSIEVSFDAQKNETVFLSIYNSLGQFIFSKKEKTTIGKNTFVINKSQLAEGLYFINVITNQLKMNSKIVITE